MSSKKRGADKYLTDENWDREQEEDDEEHIEPFKQASEEVLAKRTFKKAARRVNPNEKDKLSNPFSAFGGFGAKAVSLPTKSTSTFDVKSNNTITGSMSPSSFKGPEIITVVPPIDFFSAGTKNPDSQKTEEICTNTLVKTRVTEGTLNEDYETVEVKSKVTENKDETSDNENSDTEDKYFAEQVAALNKCLLKWIEKHIEENACIDLSAVFGDYEKHLKGISG